MWRLFCSWRERKTRKREADQLRRLDRAEWLAAVDALHHRRNNIEDLMAKMLEARRA